MSAATTISTMRRVAIVASAILFLACLPLTAYSIGENYMPAIVCLALGWFVIPSGTIAWLANPLLIWAWFAIWGETNNNKRWAAKQNTTSKPTPLEEPETLEQTYILLAALIIAATFLFVHTDSMNGAGAPRKITAKGLGYYLWLSSIAIALSGNALCYLLERVGTSNENNQ